MKTIAIVSLILLTVLAKPIVNMFETASAARHAQIEQTLNV